MKKKKLQVVKNKEVIKEPSKLFKYKGDDGKTYSMNLRQKNFCELYLELDGNGTEAIIQAGYNVTNSRGEINRSLAKSIASENLSKPYIFNYINGLLTREGFNSENVDKQHLFLINQHSDLSAKSKGIDMYNRLRGRYPKDQLEISLVSKYKTLTNEELEKIVEGEVIKEDVT